MSKQLNKEEFETLMGKASWTPSEMAQVNAYLQKTKTVGEKEPRVKTKTANKEKPQIGYTISSYNYPDFVIEKKSARQTRALCVSPSCESGGLFIKTLKNNGEWEIDNLTRENYASFMQDCKEFIQMPEDCWLPKLYTGMVFADNLIAILDNKTARAMIRNKVFPKNRERLEFLQLTHYFKIYDGIPIIYKKFTNTENDAIKNIIYTNTNWVFIKYIQHTYGLEKAIDFIESLPMSPFDLSRELWIIYDSRAIDHAYDLQTQANIRNFMPANSPDKGYVPSIPLCQMDYDRLKQYILYDAYFMGYASLGSFLTEWRDDISMQTRLFGKIREKYSMNLPSHLLKMGRRIGSRGWYYSNYNIEGFNNATKENKKYEYTSVNSNYAFIVPKNYQDFQDEADMQVNCLVNCNYINKVAKKESIIVFMREKSEMDKSCVTIEIRGNQITQAYKKYNHLPTPTQRNAIRQYAEHFDLQYNY